MGAIITSTIVGFAVGFLSVLAGFPSELVLLPLQLFLLIATIALSVRRLHDINNVWLVVINFSYYSGDICLVLLGLFKRRYR